MNEYVQYPKIAENFSSAEIEQIPGPTALISWHSRLVERGTLSETSIEGMALAWLTYCRAVKVQSLNEAKEHHDQKLARALLLCTQFNKKATLSKAIETKRSWFTEAFKTTRALSPLTVTRLVKNWTVY